MLSNAIGAIAMIGFIAVPAWAVDPPPPPAPPPPNAALAGACKQDIATLCPDVKPGEGRIAACLKTNRRQLSAGCKEAIKEHRREQHTQPPPGTSPPPTSPPPGN